MVEYYYVRIETLSPVLGWIDCRKAESGEDPSPFCSDAEEYDHESREMIYHPEGGGGID